MYRTLHALPLLLLLSIPSIAPAFAGPAPIVGGEPAHAGDWPDVVGVLGTQARCTGTLIAPDVVLTAGHCIDIDPRWVVLGSLDIAAPVDKIAVKWAKAYPRWEDKLDVGVIMLAHAARPAPRKIATACFANAALRTGATLEVVGYGLTTADATDRNSELRTATLPVIDAFCTDAPGCNIAARPNGEIAAGGRGVDSCFGDSGGPAYLAGADGPVLVGVVSRGLDVPGAPCGNGGIYTRADKAVDWIESVTQRVLARVDCDRPTDDPIEPALAPVDAEAGEGGCMIAGGAQAGFALCGFVLAIAVRRRRR